MHIRKFNPVPKVVMPGSVLLLFFSFGIAYAAQHQVAPGSSKSRQVEELIVTARKRAESVQDVPIAITAFSADQIKDASLTNLDQLAPLTPGLFFGRFSETRPQIYIRGVGSRQFDVGAEGSVGVFIDEAYVGRFSAGLAGLGDIDRIEVLKGPQGTLYGRNTIGGAINVITKDPTDELEIESEVGFGNMDYYSVEGAVSGPLVDDRLSGRLSAYYRSRDGYVTNLATGTEHNDLDQLGLRGKLSWTPAENIDIKFSLEYNRADPDSGLQGEYVTGLPVLATGGPLVPPLMTTPSRFDEFYNLDSELDREMYSATVRVDWELNPLTVTSITNYSDLDMFETRDLDSTPLESIEHRTDEESKQYTQEIRFSSKPGGLWTFEDKVEWIFGVYYLREEPIRRENLRGGLDSVFSMIAASVDGGGPPAPLAPGQIYIDNFLTVDVETTSYAVFGQATFDLTEQLALTIGARYTNDEKDAVYSGSSNRDFIPPIITPYQVTLNPDWNSFDPKVTLEYRVDDDILTYATYSQGFKSGGFQFAKFNPTEASDVFDPEEVDAYEVGLKSRWLDRRLKLNLNYFYYDYTDLQVARTTVGAGGAPAISTLNAAEATVQGLELDSEYQFTESLSLTLGYAYLDATYDDYVFNDMLNFSGNDLVRSPENTLNLALTYSTTIADGELTARGEYNWTDDYFFEPDQGLTAGTTQEDYALVNAKLSYGRGPWIFSVWGKNLTDEVYRNTTLSFGAFTMEYLNLPRTYGVSLAWAYQ